MGAEVSSGSWGPLVFFVFAGVQKTGGEGENKMGAAERVALGFFGFWLIRFKGRS